MFGEDAMEIQDLKENQREFYYQTFIEQEDSVDEDGYFTGEGESYYSNPIKARAMISENMSDTVEMPFGKDLSYDKMISTVQNLPINEYSRLFIDVVPVFNEDGSTDTEPDYEVVRVARGLYQNVWAIKMVDGYGDRGQPIQNF